MSQHTATFAWGDLGSWDTSYLVTVWLWLCLESWWENQ